jgi:Protein of unknown function (DUF3465)
MKKLLLVAVIFLAGYGYFNYQHSAKLNGPQLSATVQSTDNTDAIIYNAFANHENDLQVSGQGVVIKLLPDDISGSRHQKFIIKLASGQTLLVAHNIDLAPRVASIHEGDLIQFNGEYEWNEKGGGLHWTHRDPNGSHAAGWLKHQGHTYQ